MWSHSFEALMTVVGSKVRITFPMRSWLGKPHIYYENGLLVLEWTNKSGRLL